MYFSKLICDVCGQMIKEEGPVGPDTERNSFDLWFTKHGFGEEYEELNLDICQNCEPTVRAAVEVAIESIKNGM